MNITIIGTGYVGLVSGTCFAEMGNSVICVDIDDKKIENLLNGVVSMYEPGLDELIKRNQNCNRLTFTTDIKNAIENSEIIFCAVDTPSDNNNKADLSALVEVVRDFGKYMNEDKIFVNKSTVPVGTGDLCKKLIQKELDKRKVNFKFDVVSNPEFLREGAAIKDTMNPDRIIIGADSDKPKKLLKKLYKPLVRTNKSIVFTDIKSSETIKYAANAFLGMKISFINQIANFCELTGANIRDVSKGMGLDSRIGERFLQAGIGYGGSCFKKDIQALIETGKEWDFDFSLLKVVEEINEKQRMLFYEKLLKHIEDLEGKRIAVWGVAFKPKTDDIRYAPSISIIQKLLESKAQVVIFDPIAAEKFSKEYFLDNQNLEISKDCYSAIKGADAVLLLTEWDEFKSVDFKKVKDCMNGNLVFDGRNIYDSKEIRNAGLEYIGVGLS